MKTNCIMCPLGCELDIKQTKQGEIVVTGHTCPRGLEYGRNEVTNPMRTISSLVKFNGGVVAVKTSGLIPKSKIEEVLAEISKINLKTKPKFNQIIIKNVLNLGVDVVCIGY